jgi:hypothetical protein
MRHRDHLHLKTPLKFQQKNYSSIAKLNLRTDWRPTTLKSKSLRAFHMLVKDDSTTPRNRRVLHTRRFLSLQNVDKGGEMLRQII